MVVGDLPPLLDTAKDTLCMGPDHFKYSYGTHYVSGEKKGSSIDMKVKITTSNSKAATSVGAKLAAKGSYSGVSAEASASFKAEMKSSAEVSG